MISTKEFENTAKEFGKSAKINKINAPSLDENFLNWLLSINTKNKVDNFVHWWEGWYEALDETIVFQGDVYAERQAAKSNSAY
ncbi:MAG TPA: hypothetical protein VIZ65_14330 [Cellvibrionaceae bacterium]